MSYACMQVGGRVTARYGPTAPFKLIAAILLLTTPPKLLLPETAPRRMAEAGTPGTTLVQVGCDALASYAALLADPRQVALLAMKMSFFCGLSLILTIVPLHATAAWDATAADLGRLYRRVLSHYLRLRPIAFDDIPRPPLWASAAHTEDHTEDHTRSAAELPERMPLVADEVPGAWLLVARLATCAASSHCSRSSSRLSPASSRIASARRVHCPPAISHSFAPFVYPFECPSIALDGLPLIAPWSQARLAAVGSLSTAVGVALMPLATTKLTYYLARSVW